MLNTGPDDQRGPNDMASSRPSSRTCATAGLPMICANPDLEVIRGGVRVLCAGPLALRYQELGGDVRWLGKPDPAIYRPVLDTTGDADGAGAGGGRRRCAPISLAPRLAGSTPCWVLGGIHADELGGDLARMTPPARPGFRLWRPLRHFVGRGLAKRE